jgi:thioredoxin-related protein
MTSKIIQIALLLLSFNTLNANSIISIKSYNQALEIAKADGRQVMIFAYTDSCPYCRKMEYTTFKDQYIIDFINDNFIFTSQKVIKNQNGRGYVFKDKRVPSYLNPRYIPTTYIIDPQGEEEVRRLTGYKSPYKFIPQLID